jgi:hypothetical protein
MGDLEQDLTVEDVANFAFAPITSCEVERSFSKYKHLAEGRYAFTNENLSITFITHCNA